MQNAHMYRLTLSKKLYFAQLLYYFTAENIKLRIISISEQYISSDTCIYHPVHVQICCVYDKHYKKSGESKSASKQQYSVLSSFGKMHRID